MNKEVIHWCIEGSTKRPCWNCGKETYNVSLAFETPMCSEECDNIKYREYEEEVRKMIEKEERVMKVVKCDHCGEFVAEHNAKPCVHPIAGTWYYCIPCDYNMSGIKEMKTCSSCNEYGKHRDSVCTNCGYVEIIKERCEV